MVLGHDAMNTACLLFHNVTVLGLPRSIVCVTGGSWTERSGHVMVEVPGGGRGVSGHIFTYQVT